MLFVIVEVFWSSLLPLTTSQECFVIVVIDASSSVGRIEGFPSFEVVGSSPTLRPNSLIPRLCIG